MTCVCHVSTLIPFAHVGPGVSVKDACDHVELVRHTADCSTSSTTRDNRRRESTRTRLLPFEQRLQELGRKTSATVVLPQRMPEGMFQQMVEDTL